MASTSYPSSPAPSPKGALPKSSQKGREFLRQTDDDKGPMLIEQFIYRRDRYRSSSTAFPFPLPMRLENLPPYLQSELTPSPAVRQEIMESLREHQIQAFNIGVYGQSKVSYPNGQSCVCFCLAGVHCILWPATVIDIAKDSNSTSVHQMLARLPYGGRTIGFHLSFKHERSWRFPESVKLYFVT